MLVKREWHRFKRLKLIKEDGTAGRVHCRYYTGYFLFGFIPVYIRVSNWVRT